MTLHAVEYELHGIKFGITIEGSAQEAHSHCWRLGMTYLGPVVHQENGELK